MNYNMETGAIESIISVPICERVVNCDVNEDISVPEGYSEVRKVIALRENIMSPAKFVGARSVDFSGAVDYTLIYVGADGKLYSMPVSSEYSFSLPFDSQSGFDAGEGVSVVCSLSGENSSVRISTPRRIQLRAGIRASVLCFGKMACAEEARGIDDVSSIQRLQQSAECAYLSCESSDVVMLEDEYFIGDESRVVYSHANIALGDSYIDGEVVRVSGETSVSLAVENGENIDIVQRRIPFDAEIDVDDLDISGGAVLCKVGGSVNELSVSVEEGKAKIEVAVIIDVCSAQNKEFSYTRDLYSTKQACSVEYKKLSLPRVLINKNANMTQTERLSCEEIGLPSDVRIIDLWASAICESAELENGRYVFRGKVKYKVIYTADGKIGVSDFEEPFKYESEIGNESVQSFIASVTVMNIRGRCDRENLLIESEMALSLSAFGAQSIETVSVASFGEAVNTGKNQFIVCFKGSEESSFDLAKRYNVSVDDISEEAEKSSFVIIER